MRLTLIKISVFFVLFGLFHPFANAQKAKVRNLPNYDNSPYHFGFVLGMNQMLFSVKTNPGFQDISYYALQTPDLFADSSKLYGLEHKPAYGFTIGIVSNLRIGDYLDLRFIPSLSFGERDLQYSVLTYFQDEVSQSVISKKIQSTFIEFPLQIKYKGNRLNNIRPYWLVGAKYALDLASDSKKKEESNNIYVALERNDVYADLGGGIDIYTTFFKFGIELKMSYGLRDILKRQGNIYTLPVDRINSKLFLLSFTFE
ncbi:MAG: PorT family protein [Lentimicrobiaceae bacterium]|nr:PorT family protein [Lentimicrobiaceae bacterium]MCO5264953.1 PorT family protein [Lentimicrobium sp.]HPG33862.1 outer membrane beta-barrel protein [Lentimicrobium sp.]